VTCSEDLLPTRYGLLGSLGLFSRPLGLAVYIERQDLGEMDYLLRGEEDLVSVHSMSSVLVLSPPLGPPLPSSLYRQDPLVICFHHRLGSCIGVWKEQHIYTPMHVTFRL
jgi:hypothetical protein